MSEQLINPMDNIAIQDACKIIQDHFPPARTEILPVAEAAGQALAKDVLAREASPRFDSSAMDGFAVKWMDIDGASQDKPAVLEMIGESKAGEPYTGTVNKGQAVRINTGAMLPKGANTVVPVELTSTEENNVVINKSLEKGKFVRPAGSEFMRGDLLLKAGATLTPGCLGLLVSQGIAEVNVICRPRVSLVITGTELVPPDLTPMPGQVRDANSIILKSALTISRATLGFHTRTGDNLNGIRQAINKAAENADIVIVSGGVSVGPHDLVKAASLEAGFEKLFWGIKQKPGKPMYLAKRGHTLLFGLPGNMVSALNCYAYYIHPFLLQLGGKSHYLKKIGVVMTQSFHNTGDRTLFLRVQIEEKPGQTLATPIPMQESHRLSSIGEAHGFIPANPGEKLDAQTSQTVTLYPWYRL